MVPLACAAGLLAGERLEEITQQAKQMVNSGKGGELLLLPGWWYVATAESFLDLLTEVPDILQLAPSISCPVLYLRGEREPRDLYPAEEFRNRTSGACSVEIVPDCDHFYVGREQAVAALVRAWLSRVSVL